MMEYAGPGPGDAGQGLDPQRRGGPARGLLPLSAACTALIGLPAARAEAHAPVGVVANGWLGLPWWLWILAVVAVVLAVAGSMVWHWRFRVVAYLASLSMRIRRRDVAGHPLRSSMVVSVRVDPGIPLKDLARSLGAPVGRVRRHARFLERSGAFDLKRGDDGTLLVMPAGLVPGQRLPEELGGRDVARRVLAAVVSRPGVLAPEAAEDLGLPEDLVRYHVARLVEADLVKVRRTRAGLRVWPTELGENETTAEVALGFDETNPVHAS